MCLLLSLNGVLSSVCVISSHSAGMVEAGPISKPNAAAKREYFSEVSVFRHLSQMHTTPQNWGGGSENGLTDTSTSPPAWHFYENWLNTKHTVNIGIFKPVWFHYIRSPSLFKFPQSLGIVRDLGHVQCMLKNKTVENKVCLLAIVHTHTRNWMLRYTPQDPIQRIVMSKESLLLTPMSSESDP